MKMINDPMVKVLVDTFDLETPEQQVLEICDYEYKDGVILIKKIKVLDSELNFVRFANLEKVTKYLSKYYCNFNDIVPLCLKLLYYLRLYLLFCH